MFYSNRLRRSAIDIKKDYSDSIAEKIGHSASIKFLIL